MLVFPPAILEMVRLQLGAKVSIAVKNGRLIVAPETRKRYSLNELLAQCDASAPLPGEDAQWIASAPTGQELM
jgi:antitoxin ChpS